MSREPNYEELYHLMNRRRGEELVQLKKIVAHVSGLLHMFQETDRMLADCAETQSAPPPVTPEQHIHMFLWKLNPRCYLRRHTDTWLTLKIMLEEGGALESMSQIYQRAAGEADCTPSRIERSLSSYRKTAEQADTEYYRENLAECSRDNALFYRSALLLLRQELEQLFPTA